MKTIMLFLLMMNASQADIGNVFKREEIIHDLPPNLLKALCFVESRNSLKLNYKFDVYSNSYGMCQIKIEAAKDVGFKHHERLLAQPDINIRIAAKYLKMQIDRYGGDIRKGITAYNRGSVKRNTNLNNSYVRKVLGEWTKM